MSERVAPVEKLHAAGFLIGPDPDAPCVTCHHRWGSHRLHVDFEDDENRQMSGLWSCPECICSGTWNVGWPGAGVGHPCDFGRHLKPLAADVKYECTRTGDHQVHLTDAGADIWLCDVHIEIVNEANRRASGEALP